MTLPPAIAMALVITLFLLWAGLLFVALATGRIWLRGFAHGLPVPLGRIIGMRLRGTPAQLVVDACVALRHQGVQATIDDVERAWLASDGRVLSSADLADTVRRHGGAG